MTLSLDAAAPLSRTGVPSGLSSGSLSNDEGATLATAAAASKPQPAGIVDKGSRSAPLTVRWKIDNDADSAQFIDRHAAQVAPYMRGGESSSVTPTQDVAFKMVFLAAAIRLFEEKRFSPPGRPSLDGERVTSPDHMASALKIPLDVAQRYMAEGTKFNESFALVRDRHGVIRNLVSKCDGTVTGRPDDEQQKLCMATTQVGDNFREICAHNQTAKQIHDLSETRVEIGPRIAASGNATAAGVMAENAKLHHGMSILTLGIAPSSPNDATMVMAHTNQVPPSETTKLTSGDRTKYVLEQAVERATPDALKAIGTRMRQAIGKDDPATAAQRQQAQQRIAQARLAFEDPHMLSIEVYDPPEKPGGKKQGGLSDITGPYQSDIDLGALASLARYSWNREHLGNGILQITQQKQHAECQVESTDPYTGKRVMVMEHLPLQSDTKRKDEAKRQGHPGFDENGRPLRHDNLGVHKIQPHDLYFYDNATWGLAKPNLSDAKQNPKFNMYFGS